MEDPFPWVIPHDVSGHLCVEFVNSRFTNHKGTGEVYDRLDQQRWRDWFTARAGGVVADAPSPTEYRELVGLRELLRDLIEAGDGPDPDTLAQLNDYLAQSHATPQLHRTATGYELNSVRPVGWQAVIAEVVLSYAELLASGQIGRVRCCANPDCSYLFVDMSRNASRRWCDPAACGNLHNVRSHRQRSSK